MPQISIVQNVAKLTQSGGSLKESSGNPDLHVIEGSLGESKSAAAQRVREKYSGRAMAEAKIAHLLGLAANLQNLIKWECWSAVAGVSEDIFRESNELFQARIAKALKQDELNFPSGSPSQPELL